MSIEGRDINTIESGDEFAAIPSRTPYQVYRTALRVWGQINHDSKQFAPQTGLNAVRKVLKNPIRYKYRAALAF